MDSINDQVFEMLPFYPERDNPPYCKCVGVKNEILQCRCGEEYKIFEWRWENKRPGDDVVFSNGNRDVLFHPVYSSGTAAVKGTQPFQENLHYYWEIKILTKLYGSAIMIGVGTSEVNFSDWKFNFTGMLGYDTESWGLSYTGEIKHGALKRKYCNCFSLGCLVGVHLNMCSGTLEYYLNRRPLGVAFTNLKKHKLYPMLCSTAAKSAMRITCALSEVPTLQMECLKVIKKHSILLDQYWNIPSLSRVIKNKYFWFAPQPPKIVNSWRENEKNSIKVSQNVTQRQLNSKKTELAVITGSEDYRNTEKDKARDVIYWFSKLHARFDNFKDYVIDYNSSEYEAPQLDLEDEVVLSKSTLSLPKLCFGLICHDTPRADPDHISYRIGN